MVSREGRHEKGEIGYSVGGQSSRRMKGRKEMRLEGEDKGRRRREGTRMGTRQNGRKGRNIEVEKAGREGKRNP